MINKKSSSLSGTGTFGNLRCVWFGDKIRFRWVDPCFLR
uniref:Uncharacterized protein n=1 Tax=Arundo donax TaxID=35708 RepID=A0A0A9ALH2_ARUDO